MMLRTQLFELGLHGIEVILNQYLYLDPETPIALSELKDKVIAIATKENCIYFSITSTQIKITQTVEKPVTVKIKTDLFEYLNIITQNTVASRQLQLSGDLECAQKFQSLFKNRHIDWEEQLSKLFGDHMAYIIVLVLKTGNSWVKDTTHSLQTSLREYLVESKILPIANDMTTCSEAVYTLQEETERLAARIDYLEKLL